MSSKLVLLPLLLFSLCISSYRVVGHEHSELVLNVDEFGARGDGADDTEAFVAAWEAACSSSTAATLLVPENTTYLLNRVVFYGPCRSHVTVTIKGTIEASTNRSDWDADRLHWILFHSVKNLVVQGGGTIDGNGQFWWPYSCKVNKSLPCIHGPTALSFNSCRELTVDNLKLTNSQQYHLEFDQCNHVKASNLTVTAPKTSPNTDGIRVLESQNVQITNCLIQTGDDCIAIIEGSRRITVTNIICGPGHGISIGSLGVNQTEAHVKNVMVDNVVLTGTDNGVRIKTWQGGRGLAKNFIFQNIVMHDVSNPINVNQSYCDPKIPCPSDQKSTVKISGIMYKNITGTSASKVAVAFNCSRSVPCRKVIVQDINLVYKDGGITKSLCKNVELKELGKVFPSCSEYSD